MSVTAVIPFKSLEGGKSRLASVLDVGTRRRLCLAMLERTLHVASGLALGPVIVVTDDVEVRGLVEGTSPACWFLRASAPLDLNKALGQAVQCAPANASVVVVPTDLVNLNGATLASLIGDPRMLSIAPDLREQGTNLLHLPVAAIAGFQFQFGAGSYRKHLAEALRIGLSARIFKSPRAAFDVDTPNDLAWARQRPCRGSLALPRPAGGAPIVHDQILERRTCKTSLS